MKLSKSKLVRWLKVKVKWLVLQTISAVVDATLHNFRSRIWVRHYVTKTSMSAGRSRSLATTETMWKYLVQKVRFLLVSVPLEATYCTYQLCAFISNRFFSELTEKSARVVSELEEFAVCSSSSVNGHPTVLLWSTSHGDRSIRFQYVLGFQLMSPLPAMQRVLVMPKTEPNHWFVWFLWLSFAWDLALTCRIDTI